MHSYDAFHTGPATTDSVKGIIVLNAQIQHLSCRLVFVLSLYYSGVKTLLVLAIEIVLGEDSFEGLGVA